MSSSASGGRSVSGDHYLRHVDGLRAIAVIAVIFFHYELLGFTGGFVGVDVFFVISGALITGIIRKELATSGTFRFGAFYRRRFWRLFPALLLTVALTFLASIVVLAPKDLQQLSGSAVTTILGVSNIFFWLQSGYFDTEAASKPLLHTWSLSVEMQFYLLWPLLLWATSKIGFKTTLGAIGTPLILSLGANLLYGAQPTALFFLSPFRVFEFCIGGGLACILERHRPQARIADLAVLSGLGLIIWSALAFSKTTPFPTYNALVPCLGAALAIYGGQGRAGAVLLSNRLSVHVGRISYSLYLVHWPVLILVGYYYMNPLGYAAKLLLGILSLLVAEASYRLVEVPLRAWRPSRATVDIGRYIWAGALAITVAAPASYAWLVDPFTARLSAREQLYYSQLAAPELADCRETRAFANMLSNCGFGIDKGEHFDVVLMGDSHARVMRSGLIDFMNERGLSAVWVGAGSTIPLMGAIIADDGLAQPEKTEKIDAIYAEILRLKPRAVILMARWDLDYNTVRPFADGRRYVHDQQSEENSVEASQDALRRSYRHTIVTLNKAGIAVFALSSIPNVGQHVPDCFFRNREGNCNFSTPAEVMRQNEAFNAFAKQTVENSGMNVWFEITSRVCDPSRNYCDVNDDQGLFFMDPNHFSVFGAKRFFERFMRADFTRFFYQLPATATENAKSH